MGRLSATKCTYLPAYLALMLILVAPVMLMVRMLPAVLRVLAPLVMPIARALLMMPWWMLLLVIL